MTAQNFIDNLKPLLTGLAVKTDDAVLLSFLNMAKDEIARDTMFWIDGEQITGVADTTEYTLSVTPIQIIDVYDSANNIITRGSYSDDKGYFQTSPSKIQFTYQPNVGSYIYVNYYYSPEDYGLDDNIDIPSSLYKAIRHFMISEALNMFKGEKEIMNARNHYSIYTKQIEKFIAQTDVLSSESLLRVDMIKAKGLV